MDIGAYQTINSMDIGAYAFVASGATLPDTRIIIPTGPIQA